MAKEEKPQVELKNWRIEKSWGGHCALMGISQNHPRMADGIEIRSSRLLRIDFETGLAETMNTIYRLEGLGDGN